MAPPGTASGIPLDVATYREGWLRLRGWACFSALAFLTGALLVLYELVIINVEDRDFRDMLHDYRVTQPGIMYQHKHFVNAAFCCHDDPAVFGYSCSDWDADRVYYGAPWGWYQQARHPHCPPFITFTCADLYSPECGQTRAAVYAAAGLDPQTGRPADCGRAGRVRLRARGAAPGADTRSSRLTVEWQGQQQQEAFTLQDSAAADMQQLRAFVDQVARRYADELYVMPSAPLARGLRVNGAAVALSAAADPGAPDTNSFGWPWELWPWPPGWACANTGRPPALYLQGSAPLEAQPGFSPAEAAAQPPLLRLQLYGDEVRVPLYRVQLAVADALVVGADGGLQLVTAAQQLTNMSAAAGGNASEAAGLAELAAAAEGYGLGAGGGGSSGGGGGAEVAVAALSSVTVRAGFAAVLDACSAWMLDQEWVDAAYGTPVWQGSLAEWQQLAASGATLAPPDGQIELQLRDVSEPLPLALPRYGGNIYIYAAIALGGAWMFSTAPLLLAGILVAVNVQRRRGLPLFVYRYMRRYRGW